MTIESQKNKIQHIADGVETSFNYDFRVDRTKDFQVYLDDVLQVYGSTYAIDDEKNLGDPSGGVIVFSPDPPASGVVVLIMRVVVIDQTVDYKPYDPFPAETHELALDHGIMIDQQFEERFGRSVLAPESDDGTTDYTMPPYESGLTIGWAIAEKSLTNYGTNLSGTPAGTIPVISASNYNTLNEAVAAIGATRATLMFDKTLPVVATLETLASLNFSFPSPGYYIADDSNNANLTINGLIDANFFQIFDWGNGSGDLTINSPIPLKSSWFDNHSVDIGLCVNKAMAAFSPRGGTLVLPYTGVYPLVTPIDIKGKPVRLLGGGWDSTVLEKQVDAVGITVRESFSELGWFKITSNVPGGDNNPGLIIGTAAGVPSDGCNRMNVHDINISGQGSDGMVYYQGNNSFLSRIRLTGNGQDGLRIAASTVDANVITFGGIDASGNTRDGIRFDDTAFTNAGHYGGVLAVQSNGGVGLNIVKANGCYLFVYQDNNVGRSIEFGPNSNNNTVQTVAGGFADPVDNGNKNLIYSREGGSSAFSRTGEWSFSYKGPDTNSINRVVVLSAESTGTKADGFGAGLIWQTDDSASPKVDVAGIAGVRDTFVDAGAVVILTNNAGVLTERARWTRTGILSLMHTLDPNIVTQTLTGNKSIGAADGNVFILDPNGADRDILIGSSPKLVFIVNTADAAESLFFDSAGINQPINQGQSGIFAHDGSAWKKIFVG